MAGQHATIEVLPNEVLLHIFLCHRPGAVHCYDRFLKSYDSRWEWHVLVHVCRRWRYLIFTSPRHLGLGLTLDKKHKDCWPALPIFLQYNRDYTPDVIKESFFAALKHHDRIYGMSLIVSSWMFTRSNTWMEQSFPELQCLNLRSSCGDLTILPSTFLNRPTSTPNQLCHIRLQDISIPALPQFLQVVRSHNLVFLSLGPNFLAGERFPSPETLVAALSATPRLRLLSLYDRDDSRIPYPEQGSTLPPLQDLTGLPILTTLTFEGSVEYLEDLVSRIHAPLVEQLVVSVSFSRRRVIEIPQLSEFISRTKELSSIPFRTSIDLSSRQLTINHGFEDPPPQWTHEEKIFLNLKCRHVSWEMSQVIRICRQSSRLMSCLRRLDVSMSPSPFLLDPMSWLQLFGPFNGVEILRVCHWSETCQCGILEPLVQSTTKMVLAMLPALRILKVGNCSGSADCFPRLLIAMRKCAGRPLEVYHDWRSGDTGDMRSCGHVFYPTLCRRAHVQFFA